MAKRSTTKKITVVRFDHRSYMFADVGEAAKAIAFFGKLKPVDFQQCDVTGKYHYGPSDRKLSIELDTDREFREVPERHALPAPQRDTVPCSVGESVSVKRGKACQSCGTICED